MKTAVMRAEAVPLEAPKGRRKQSTDCTDYTERPQTASSRQALAEPNVAGLAGTPHPGRQKWQNRPIHEPSDAVEPRGGSRPPGAMDAGKRKRARLKSEILDSSTMLSLLNSYRARRSRSTFGNAARARVHGLDAPTPSGWSLLTTSYVASVGCYTV